MDDMRVIAKIRFLAHASQNVQSTC